MPVGRNRPGHQRARTDKKGHYRQQKRREPTSAAFSFLRVAQDEREQGQRHRQRQEGESQGAPAPRRAQVGEPAWRHQCREQRRAAGGGQREAIRRQRLVGAGEDLAQDERDQRRLEDRRRARIAEAAIARKDRLGHHRADAPRRIPRGHDRLHVHDAQDQRAGRDKHGGPARQATWWWCRWAARPRDGPASGVVDRDSIQCGVGGSQQPGRQVEQRARARDISGTAAGQLTVARHLLRGGRQAACESRKLVLGVGSDMRKRRLIARPQPQPLERQADANDHQRRQRAPAGDSAQSAADVAMRRWHGAHASGSHTWQNTPKCRRAEEALPVY